MSRYASMTAAGGERAAKASSRDISAASTIDAGMVEAITSDTWRSHSISTGPALSRFSGAPNSLATCSRKMMTAITIAVGHASDLTSEAMTSFQSTFGAYGAPASEGRLWVEPPLVQTTRRNRGEPGCAGLVQLTCEQVCDSLGDQIHIALAARDP